MFVLSSVLIIVLADVEQLMSDFFIAPSLMVFISLLQCISLTIDLPQF